VRCYSSSTLLFNSEASHVRLWYWRCGNILVLPCRRSWLRCGTGCDALLHIRRHWFWQRCHHGLAVGGAVKVVAPTFVEPVWVHSLKTCFVPHPVLWFTRQRCAARRPQLLAALVPGTAASAQGSPWDWPFAAPCVVVQEAALAAHRPSC
jgi:hypothetical protein